MSRAEGIRKFGFRRWYERQLIEGHAYLVTCFLCMILVPACVEGFSWHAPGWTPVIMVAIMLAGGFICVASWRRYHVVLVRAEHTGEQSTCSECHTYGRYHVLEPAPFADHLHSRWFERSSGQPDLRLKVRCRKCGHEWLIE